MLFRSRRPGIGGQPFDCLKFRTMHTDAEQRQEELEGAERGHAARCSRSATTRASRAIGGLLRRYSLDELPQLVNVLRGEMSMVGPRPLPMRDYDRLEDWHRKRYLVLPGITGLWQVSGRAELDFDELVRLDFLYLERWSVFLDLSILLKTLPAVLSAARARSSALASTTRSGAQLPGEHDEIWRSCRTTVRAHDCALETRLHDAGRRRGPACSTSGCGDGRSRRELARAGRASSRGSIPRRPRSSARARRTPS